MTNPPRTAVYVDGFNLYYSLKGTPNKWLDLAALCDRMLAGEQINRVHYFTAHVKQVDDPQQPSRQQAYLRALRSTPRVFPFFGRFQVNTHTLPLSQNGSREMVFGKGGHAGTKVSVLKFEEKGSDVNLATFLLIDAHANAYDHYVVLSNDSDLEEPIRHVTKTLGRRVSIMNAIARPSTRLVSASSGRFIPLTQADFAATQLPNPVYDRKGPITMPPKWGTPPY